ncbi:MAG: caspase family protein [Bacteroidaceae bacterium]|nr:caspase family protein [Bacteroidaceae bacterium]
MKQYIVTFIVLLSHLLCFGQSSDPIIKGMERSALEGNVSAQRTLGNCYYYGTMGCSKNMDKAKHYYQLAANQGDTEAEYMLARILRTIGLKTQDEAKIYFGHLQSAADKGYVPAQYGVGMELLNANMPEAYKYLKLAVDNGNKDAFYPLGICYMEGLGCSVDYTTAILYFKKGQETVPENVFVMDMAQCYVKLNDVINAKPYLEKGIAFGIPTAYQVLAIMLTNGEGVNKDSKEALRLINIAISKDPTNPEYKDTKGSILMDLSRFDEAQELWNELVREHKEYAYSKEWGFCSYMRKIADGNVDMDIFQTEEENANTYVIIIANENYRREETVPYALNDGNIFKLYCQKTLGIPEKNINYLPDATFNDIRYSINWLEKITSASSDSKIIFYYAGHGVPNDDLSTSYLLPTDGYGSDVQTGYDLKELYKKLENVRADQIIVILDACFSGAKRDGGMLVSSRGVAIKAKQSEPLHNMVVLSAAQNNETAYPYKNQKHGMFTYYILKKLQESKGNTTIGDLFSYVNSQVSKQSVLENGKSQTPTLMSGAGLDWHKLKLK